MAEYKRADPGLIICRRYNAIRFTPWKGVAMHVKCVVNEGGVNVGS